VLAQVPFLYRRWTQASALHMFVCRIQLLFEVMASGAGTEVKAAGT